MIPQKTKCFIIIVHYGDVAVTQKALDCLYQSSRIPDLVVVVDQAVQPVSLKGNSQNECLVVRPQANNGYFAGLNVGFKELLNHGIQDEDIVVGMNNDVLVGSTSLVELEKWHLSQKRTKVLAGAKLRTINMFSGRAEQSFFGKNYIDGAFLSASWKVWQVLYPLPESYFLYSEDVLLSWRAQAQGFTVKPIPELSLSHVSQNSAPSDDKLYYLVRNGARVLEEENFGLWKWYWKVANRFRLFYHLKISTNNQSHIIAQALVDASHKKGGRYTLSV